MKRGLQPGLRDFADPARFDITSADRELFEQKLGNFIPPNAFDAHAHWYDLRHILETDTEGSPPDKPEVGFEPMQTSMKQWMGDRVIRQGLYFGFPVGHLDCAAANQFVAGQLREHPDCRGLMLIRPEDDPAQVEAAILENRFSGFKVYHVFASREDTFNATQGEFLPGWAWELAHRHGLWITMHMVRPKALSDSGNLEYIRKHCRQYPNAHLVLAHAARGFSAAHTVDAIDGLRDIDNVFFDTSAVCEPAAFEAIIRATGTTRLMYGSDFPVSELRGKAFSVGDGFMWLYGHSVDWDAWPHGQPVPVGIESLLALQQASRTMALNDRDLERIFGGNARQLLGMDGVMAPGTLVQDQYRAAKKIIPGGTQLLSKRPEMFAPGHWPAYYEEAVGCQVGDTTGRRFIDMSLGGILACILGYADPDVNAAVIRRVHLGSMATQQTHDEVRLAELLLKIHPWATKARFTRTGGEAAAVAVRIARAATGREKVAICGYHGWHDWYLAANLGDTGPDSLKPHLLPGLKPAGVPISLKGTTLPFGYNQLEELDQIIEQHSDGLAAIVMEPTRHLDPEPGFLEGVRERASRIGAKLVFDEISIGWRVCLGGSHLKLEVEPDLAIFAKAISNGFAMGAVIGDAETMSAAEGSFISSAYWTEGIGPAAAVATIEKMSRLDVPGHLARIGDLLCKGWAELGREHSVPVTIGGRAEMVLIGFDHADANALMTLFTTRMLDHGFLASGGFNPTMAHEPSHVERYLEAAGVVFAEIEESVERNDVMQRIGARPKHTMFARLTD